MAEKKPRANSRRAPAKKSSKKKTTTKSKVAKKAVVKKTTKKVAKKTTKKVTKKTAKKVVKKTPKTAKKVTKKAAAKKKPAKTTKKTKVVKKKDSVTLGTTHDSRLENQSVTIFSRVKTDHAVMLVARVLGLVFVFLGAASTVVGLGRLYDIDGVAALTVVATESLLATSHATCDVNIDPMCDVMFSGTSATDIPGTATTPSSGSTQTQTSQNTGGTGSTNVTNINTQPTANINVPSQPVSDMAEIIVSVVDAERVYLRAYHQNSGSQIDLGRADSQDGTIWKYQWDTSTIAPGQYKITAHITNQYGAYHESADRYLERADDAISPNVSNTGSTATQTGGTSTTPQTTNTNQQPTQAPSLVGTTSTQYPTDNQDDEKTIDQVDTERSTEPFDYEDPDVEVILELDEVLSGVVPVTIKVAGVRFSEVYVRQNDSLREQFVGLARETDSSEWKFAWDTTKTPNGKYDLFTKHRSDEGYFYSDTVKVEINNTPVITTDEANVTYINQIDRTDELAPNPTRTFFDDITDDSDVSDLSSNDEVPTTTKDEIEDSEESDQETKRVTDEFLRNHKDSINKGILAYTEALRNGDTEAVRQSKENLERLGDLAASDSATTSFAGETDLIRSHVQRRLETLAEDVEKTEKIIKDRTGDAVLKDSDGDGIVDYDEVTLYGTDPFVADSDNDGFTDGAEIAGGFNPNDDSQEATIMYESPKEVGVIREDILAVEAVIAAEPVSQEESLEDDGIARAVISGRGLPNSFVTLYIFSTPIIITVKTEDDGSWNYRFDKELEDGEHQVFVGVTDNAGKIVAKSQPFTFVKEAQAFSPVDAEGAAANFVSSGDSSPTLLSQNTLLVALGAVIMALGFILLLLSMFLRKEEVVESAPQTELIHA